MVIILFNFYLETFSSAPLSNKQVYIFKSDFFIHFSKLCSFKFLLEVKNVQNKGIGLKCDTKIKAFVIMCEMTMIGCKVVHLYELRFTLLFNGDFNFHRWALYSFVRFGVYEKLQ